MAKNENVYRARKRRKERAGLAKKATTEKANIRHNAKYFKGLRQLAKMLGEQLKFPVNGYRKGYHPPVFAALLRNVNTGEKRKVKITHTGINGVKKESCEMVDGIVKVERGTPLQTHPNTIRGLIKHWKNNGPMVPRNADISDIPGATDSLLDNSAAK